MISHITESWSSLVCLFQSSFRFPTGPAPMVNWIGGLKDVCVKFPVPHRPCAGGLLDWRTKHVFENEVLVINPVNHRHRGGGE